MKKIILALITVSFFLCACVGGPITKKDDSKPVSVPVSKYEQAGHTYYCERGGNQIDKYADTGSSLADKVASTLEYLDQDMELFVHPTATFLWNDTTSWPTSWDTGFDLTDPDNTTIWLNQFYYPLPMLLDQGHTYYGKLKAYAATEAPTGVDAITGTFWLDTDDGAAGTLKYYQNGWNSATPVEAGVSAVSAYGAAVVLDGTVTFSAVTNSETDWLSQYNTSPILGVYNDEVNNDIEYYVKNIVVNPVSKTVYMGKNAGTYNAGIENVATGYNAAITSTGNYNTFVGSGAGESITSGSNIVAVGYGAARSFTTYSGATALGYKALYAATSASESTAVGCQALIANTTGDSNTATGYQALYSNTTGSTNTATGTQSLYTNTGGTYNTATGWQALYSNTNGNYNNAFGYGALYNTIAGSSNVAVGNAALYSNTSGNNNSAVGRDSLRSVASGAGNSAIGYLSGYTTTGGNNTFLGHRAGYSATTGSNNTFIGYYSYPAAVDDSNKITLGDANITHLRCQVTSITALSDRRDKKDIEPLPYGLNFINGITPVQFTWDMRGGGKTGIRDSGFIAQDLLSAEEKYGVDAKAVLGLVMESNPEKLETSPGKLIPVMVKAIQELSEKVDRLERELKIKKKQPWFRKIAFWM